MIKSRIFTLFDYTVTESRKPAQAKLLNLNLKKMIVGDQNLIATFILNYWIDYN
jgi:hypothetical protein